MLSLQRVNYYKTTFFVIPKYLDCISFNQLIMNTLEQKCAVLANTPQSLWFDMRYKALAQLLMNMEDDGLITLIELPPIPQLALYGLNFTIGVFKYDGEYYFIINSLKGTILDNFHFERTNSKYPSMLTSHIVLSSDDDPKQPTYLPMISLFLGAKSTKELMDRLIELGI